MQATKPITMNNWTDKPCYYVDCIDAGRVAYLLGPFKNKQSALDMLEAVRTYTNEHYPMSVFYSFGTLKAGNGYQDGKLNAHFNNNACWTGEDLL